MKILVLDFETTGLDEEICAITQVGATAGKIVPGEDMWGRPVYVESDYFNSRVRVPEGTAIFPVALSVQGKTYEEIMDQRLPESSKVWERFHAFWRAQGYPPIYAHHAPFDEKFLLKWQGDPKPFRRTCVRCTKQAFMLAQDEGLFDATVSSSLDALSDFFKLGKPGAGKHDALADARAAAEVLARVKGAHL